MKDMNTNFAQLDGQTVGKTNGRTNKVILIPPPPSKIKFVCGGGGYNKIIYNSLPITNLT